jgi:glycerate dehydrogenase
VLKSSPRAFGGSSLGPIGHVAPGKRVEQIARRFEMDITIGERRGDRPRAGRLPLDEVIARSDVLVILCPWTEETRGLMGSRELATMKPDALLINSVRGGIVDEPALLDAIPRGVIAGAGVDVLSEEPPSSGNVVLEAELPNLIVTPHVAWVSRESQQILADQLVDDIDAWQAGSAQNVVLR